MQPDETPTQPEYVPVTDPAQQPAPPVAPPPKPPRFPFWGYQDLALVIGLMGAAIALILLCVGATMLVWPWLRDNPVPLILPTNLAVYVFLLLVFKFVISSRYGKPMLPSLGWRMTNSTVLIYAALGGVALPFIVSGISSLLRTPKTSTQMDERRVGKGVDL